MSVADLRTRLEALSSAISRQKEVLNALEEARSAVRRELNAILDPMARLPLEISSDIFTRCLPTIPRPNPSSAPLVLLNICYAWSSIALSTPSLWSAIRVDFPRSPEFKNLLEAWITRARSRTLSISLHGSVHPSVQALVKQHAYRVQDLELYLDSGEALEAITVPLPAVKSLTIGNPNNTTYFFPYADECVAMLRAAPDLLECVFDKIYYDEDFHAFGNTLQHLTHSSLQHLRLGKPRYIYGESVNSACILQYLTLPALQSLLISDFDISHDDFLSFLDRSSPPLHTLHMSIPIEDWPELMVNRYFRLLPTLTDLDLLCENGAEGDFLFLDVLAASSEDFLPNLRHLTIRAFFPAPAEYEKLVGTLSARRASRHSPLQSFRLIWPILDWDDAPAPDIIARLHQLIAGGMEIHIGIEEISYV
ncbi:hypothetical protein C8R44DRAFT_23551 [Mycena epipterygia]|nr:hypothetical protein C8R44DRAFT_23551 [Mycena epipterygia]